MLARPARRATYHRALLGLPLLSRKFPPNLGQVKFTVVTGELERNESGLPLSDPRLSLTLAAGGGGA